MRARLLLPLLLLLAAAAVLLLLLLLRGCGTDDDAPRMHVQATVAVLRNLGAAHEVPADVADA